MPFVNIKITREATAVTPEQKAKVIEGVTDVIEKELGRNRATTIVIIEEVDTDNYGIGGVSVTQIRKKK
jgi:4-oxalocrotonate tautomerase